MNTEQTVDEVRAAMNKAVRTEYGTSNFQLSIDALKICESALRAQQERENPITFIDALRNSDKYIEMIYMDGGCYRFYLVLKTLYPSARPFMLNMGGNVPGCDHVITLIGGKYYDIRGEFDASKYELFEVNKEAKEWSFCKNNSLYAECPNCEEPVFFSTPFNPLHDIECVNQLTLEEVRERIGKPVFVFRLHYGKLDESDIRQGGWFLVEHQRIHRHDMTYSENYYWDEYGKTWTAYDHEPKEAQKG